MKLTIRTILLSTLVCLCTSDIFAQIELGIRAGLSSTDVITEGIIVNENGYNFKLTLDEANYGYHFGLYSRISFFGIFIEPNFLLSSSKTSFNLHEFGETAIIKDVFQESYQNLDIPLLIGTKLGFLRIQAGPVAHIFLSSGSDLFDIPGYEQRFQDATYGIMAGLGLDIWKMRIDLNYETNLSTFGDHITIDGIEYSFGNKPSKIIATVAWRF